MNKFLREIGLLFVANVRSSLRSVVWLVVGMFQPICYLLLFAPLLNNLTNIPGFPKGGTYNVFAPGLLIMTTILGTGLVGFNLLANLRAGVVERLRVTPVSRLAILLSMVLRDVVTLLVQCSLLVGVAVLLGMRPDWLGLGVLALLLVIIGVTMSSFSYGLTLIVKDEGGLASSVNFISIPLLLLSGITLPLALAPSIIQAMGNVNPFAYAVNASRALVNGTLGDNSIITAFAIFAALMTLALIWATRSIRQAAM